MCLYVLHPRSLPFPLKVPKACVLNTTYIFNAGFSLCTNMNMVFDRELYLDTN